ncbi:MAG: hypothetical protein PHU61_00720 [Candidatus Absconditabacteria bacterium]|nr:hypothetical protein [Candidatus Absconditabacteria bacterium]MDD3868398.1 hypothetical protein [Candidatus Absconditabacteria bacterium]MDD4714078.1 hypothetical protein [Candidatus Absconditabacteria bacterium]
MRKILAVLAVFAIALTSCTKNYYEYIEIENVTVQLDMKSIIKVNENLMRSSTTEYQHVYPSSYTAYFISNENKGEYTQGQLVVTLTVSPGNNTITIPKLDYTVYVTNYEKEGAWYTWTDAIGQLPQSTNTLYFYGKNTINYSVVVAGEVTVKNPYSAIMVLNNEWVTGAPKFYGTGQFYGLVHNNEWYLLYIRNTTVNSTVPVQIPGYSSNHIEINRAIEANKVYQFIIDASVDNTDGQDNFTVIVEEFTETVVETIKPY